jgi:P-type Cu2+ transporter
MHQHGHGTSPDDRHDDRGALDAKDEHAAHVSHNKGAAHMRPGGQSAMRHDEHAAHDKHAGHSVAMLRSKFLISLLFTLPTLIWADMIQHWLRFSAPRFPGSTYVPAIFGTAVFFYGGWVFILGAVRELRARVPGMMTLIALAITVAFAFSLAVTIGYPGMALWWELATLVTVMLLGHWIEMRSIAQASGALKELAKLLPDVALRITDGGEEEVGVAELKQGDRVLVRPGAKVPADGKVYDGSSAVNESMITGESRPVSKAKDDGVIAGTVNGSGSLRVQITATGERTALAGIMRLVEQAQTSRSRAQALADRAAFFLTIVAIVAGVATLVTWLALNAAPGFAIERLVTVLVIACPHALGLAIPLVVAISTTLGARSGLLVRDRRGLEEARNLDTVVFDKTGTLTLGEFRVIEIATADGSATDSVLARAAAIERDSEHPIAQAVVSSAKEKGLQLPTVTNFQAIAGHGVRASIEGKDVQVGGPAMLRKLGISLDAVLQQAVDRAAQRGQAAVSVIEGNRVTAVLVVADAIREESRAAVKQLHDAGIEVAMITGDARAVADAVGRELGIDTVLAEVLPEQKAERIKALQRDGRKVAMVGDGVNDAPALVTADVGIAIGAGTDVAVEAGDVVLVRSDPRDVPRIVSLSRATYRKMIQNLWWAAGYNIVAIPLAAGVAQPWGIVLPPAVGAILMSLSTVIVALNAQLLRRARL